MAIELLMLELTVGMMLLGGLVAYGRSLGERLCLLATVPVAYLISFLLAKGGLFDTIGAAIVSLLSDMNGMGEIFSASAAAKTGLEALLSCLLRPLMTMLLFWGVLIVLRIIVPLVLKICKAERASFFRSEGGEPVWRKILTCAVGAVGAYAICMLSLLPVAFFGNLASPAVEKAKDEAYNGTYVQEVLHTADENIFSAMGNTVGGKIQKYTGFTAILTASANSLSDVSLQSNDGKTVAFNGTELLQGLLCDGVDAMAIYEYSCNPDNYTVGDIAPVTNVMKHLAESEAVLQIGVEILGQGLPEDGEGEGGDLTAQLLAIVVDTYLKQDVAVMQGDLMTLATLIEKLTTDFGQQSLDAETSLEELLAYLADKDSTYELVCLLTSLGVYEDVLTVLAEYGMDALCDMLEISSNKVEYYEKFFADLRTVLNNERVEGIYYPDAVEGFIRYLVENELSVSDCMEKTEEETVVSAYESYQRYMAQYKPLAKLFADYHLDESDGTVFYLGRDGSLYAYEAKTETWSLCEADSSANACALLVELLLADVNGLFEEDVEHSVASEEILSFVSQYTTAQLRTLYPTLSETLVSNVAAVAGKIASSDAFTVNVIYREEILANLKTAATVDEAHNRTLASIIATTAGLVEKLNDDKTENPALLVLENFSLVGRLLDELHRFEVTSDVPGEVLMAITQSSEFGSYFLSDSIAELVDNVKNGVSTYEELFTSVQALYNIINQIVPV